MELFGWLVLLFLFYIGVIYVKNKINIYFYELRNKNFGNSKQDSYNVGIYTKREVMTNYERYFYNIFVELEDEMSIRVVPQVNLAAIVRKKVNNYYINELFRNIDFAIFDKDYKKLILLIEINDSTHATPKRIARDKNVEKILKDADIRLIKFYSNYPNEEEYVKNRVKQELINLMNK